MASMETQVLPVRLADSAPGSGEVPFGRRVAGLLRRSRALICQSGSPSVGLSLADPLAGPLG